MKIVKLLSAVFMLFMVSKGLLATNYNYYVRSSSSVVMVSVADPDPSKLDSEMANWTTKIKNWVKIIIGLAALIGLITVIYMVATNNPKSKEYVIAYIVALIIMAIGFAVLL